MYVATEWMKNNEANLKEIETICETLATNPVGHISSPVIEQLQAHCYAAKNGIEPGKALQKWKEKNNS